MKMNLAVLALFLCVSSVSYAQDMGDVRDVEQNPIRYPGPNQGDTTPGSPNLPQDLELTAAVGFGYQPEYMGSDDYEGIFAPAIDLEYKQRGFLVINREAMMVPYDGLGVKMLANQDFSAGFNATYDEGRDRVSAFGLNEMDWTALGGVFAAYHPGILFVRGQLGYDLLNEFNSYKGEFGAGVAGPITAQWRGMVELSTAFAGENYIDDYFGVGAFNPDGGFYRTRLTGALQYQFTQGAFVEGLLRYDQLTGDAENSPIVDDKGQFSATGMVGYKF